MLSYKAQNTLTAMCETKFHMYTKQQVKLYGLFVDL
jgi:hypothetical protein